MSFLNLNINNRRTRLLLLVRHDTTTRSLIAAESNDAETPPPAATAEQPLTVRHYYSPLHVTPFGGWHLHPFYHDVYPFGPQAGALSVTLTFSPIFRTVLKYFTPAARGPAIVDVPRPLHSPLAPLRQVSIEQYFRLTLFEGCIRSPMHRWMRPVITRPLCVGNQRMLWNSLPGVPELGVAPRVLAVPLSAAGLSLGGVSSGARLMPSLLNPPSLLPAYGHADDTRADRDQQEEGTQSQSVAAGQMRDESQYHQQNHVFEDAIDFDNGHDNRSDSQDGDGDDTGSEEEQRANGQDDSDSSSRSDEDDEVAAAAQDNPNAAPAGNGVPPAEGHYEWAVSSSDEGDDDDDDDDDDNDDDDDDDDDDDESVGEMARGPRPAAAAVNGLDVAGGGDGVGVPQAVPLRAHILLGRPFPRLRSRYSLVDMPTEAQRQNAILRILYDYVVNAMELNDIARAAHQQSINNGLVNANDPAPYELPEVPPVPAFLSPLLESGLRTHFRSGGNGAAAAAGRAEDEVDDIGMDVDDAPPGPNDGAGDGQNINDPQVFFRNLASLRRARAPRHTDGRGDGPDMIAPLAAPPFGFLNLALNGLGNRGHLNGVVIRVPPLARGGIVGQLNVPLQHIEQPEAGPQPQAQAMPRHLRIWNYNPAREQAPPPPPPLRPFLVEPQPLPPQGLPADIPVVRNRMGGGDGPQRFDPLINGRNGAGLGGQGNANPNAPGPVRSRTAHTLPRNWPVGFLTRRQRREVQRQLNDMLNSPAPATPPTVQGNGDAGGDGPSVPAETAANEARAQVIGDGNAPQPENELVAVVAPLVGLPRRLLTIETPNAAIFSIITNWRPIAAAWLHLYGQRAVEHYGDAVIQHRAQPCIDGGMMAPQVLTENYARIRKLLRTLPGELSARFRVTLMELCLYATIGLESATVSHALEILKKLLMSCTDSSQDTGIDLRGLSMVPAFLQQRHSAPDHYERSLVTPSYWYRAPDTLFGPARPFNSVIHEHRGVYNAVQFIRDYYISPQGLDAHRLQALKLIYGNQLFVLISRLLYVLCAERRRLAGTPNANNGLQIVELPPNAQGEAAQGEDNAPMEAREEAVERE